MPKYLFLLSALVLPSSFVHAQEFPGITSPYSAKIEARLKSWPPASLPTSPTNVDEVRVKCVTTPGDEWYLGFQAIQWVKAPLDRLAQIIQDYESYPKLFPDLKQVKILKQEGPLTITAWERSVPIPFVPNEKFELAYLVETPSSSRRVIRYRLHREGRIQKNDGAVVLDQITPDHVRMTQYSFYNAEWGPAKALGNRTIWLKNTEGVLKQAWAMSLLAENPGQKPEWARNEAKDRAQKVKKKDGALCEETVPEAELWK